jgi:hypothetical protein
LDVGSRRSVRTFVCDPRCLGREGALRAEARSQARVGRRQKRNRVEVVTRSCRKSASTEGPPSSRERADQTGAEPGCGPCLRCRGQVDPCRETVDLIPRAQFFSPARGPWVGLRWSAGGTARGAAPVGTGGAGTAVRGARGFMYVEKTGGLFRGEGERGRERGVRVCAYTRVGVVSASVGGDESGLGR